MNRVALAIPDSWRTAAALRKRRAGPLDNSEPVVAQTRAAHLRAVPLAPAIPASSRSSCAGQQDLSDHSEIRTPPIPVKRDLPAAESDTTLYLLMFGVGLVLVATGMVRGGSWGVGPTIGGLACVFAARALVVAQVVRLRDRRKRVI
jgi:hypothetical protein